MKINWKLRLQNKATLAALVSAGVTFGYAAAGALGVEIPVDESTAFKAAGALLSLLSMAGVLIDPTTAGIADSDEAMTYSEPKK